MKISFFFFGNRQEAAAFLSEVKGLPALTCRGWFYQDPQSVALVPETIANSFPHGKAHTFDPPMAKEIDWIFSLDSTYLFSTEAISGVKRGILNAHPGPLPKYPGLRAARCAVQRGEQEFGATLHWVDSGIDTGPIVSTSRLSVSPHDSGLSLTLCALKAARKLLFGAVKDLAAGLTLPRTPQCPGPAYHYEKGPIDWTAPAEVILRRVRADDFLPFHFPERGADLVHGNRSLTILRAESAAFLNGGVPGSVIVEDSTGIRIACGNGSSILATSILRNGKPQYFG